MSNTLIIIPSRMSATRLPGKPLLKINGLSIISHVVKKAKETEIGEVIVATENEEILDDVKQNKGEAIFTSKANKTGTDRIWEAYKKLNYKDVDFIINLQGDEPLIDPDDIKNLDKMVKDNSSEIGTLATTLESEKILINENIVKVKTKDYLKDNNSSLAENFFRKINNNHTNLYHHIGIYEYEISCLEKFSQLKQTENEIKNRLEQLRALDNNINIDVILAKSKVLGVDTMEDYIELKKIMEYKS